MDDSSYTHLCVDPKKRFSWGRTFWDAWFYAIACCPSQMDGEDYANVVSFMHASVKVLCCHICRKHATEYLESNRYKMPRPVEGYYSRRELLLFVIRFKNEVNKRQGRPLRDEEAALRFWDGNEGELRHVFTEFDRYQAAAAAQSSGGPAMSSLASWPSGSSGPSAGPSGHTQYRPLTDGTPAHHSRRLRTTLTYVAGGLVLLALLAVVVCRACGRRRTFVR
jgi:hypothetical protein